MAYCMSPVTRPKLARLNVIEKYLYLHLGDRKREKLSDYFVPQVPSTISFHCFSRPVRQVFLFSFFR